MVTKRDLTEYLYSRLPNVYATEDKETILRRFIEVFVEGGFNPLLTEASKIMDLLDVDKCPSEFLPYLCKMYGYEYTLEIPELFQRRLLKYIVDMYKRKGTKSVVKFIARELTGFESEIIENKDFDDELIKITKWDKRFEHYRNFVLKLTAPFEDSSLYNKENIVVKITNDFIPTNSQVFVITSYWFKEESSIAKNSFYELTEFLNDYTGNFTIKAEVVSSEQDVFYKLKEHSYLEKTGIVGETQGFLNLSSPLFTNAFLRIKDIVRFNPHEYSDFLKAYYNGDTEEVIKFEGMFVNNLSKYLESIHTQNLKDLKLVETTSISSYSFTKYDTIRTLKYRDVSSIRNTSREHILTSKNQDEVGNYILVTQVAFSENRLNESLRELPHIENTRIVGDTTSYLNKSYPLFTNAVAKLLDIISLSPQEYSNFLFYGAVLDNIDMSTLDYYSKDVSSSSDFSESRHYTNTKESEEIFNNSFKKSLIDFLKDYTGNFEVSLNIIDKISKYYAKDSYLDEFINATTIQEMDSYKESINAIYNHSSLYQDTQNLRLSVEVEDAVRDTIEKSSLSVIDTKEEVVEGEYTSEGDTKSILDSTHYNYLFDNKGIDSQIVKLQVEIFEKVLNIVDTSDINKCREITQELITLVGEYESKSNSFEVIHYTKKLKDILTQELDKVYLQVEEYSKSSDGYLCEDLHKPFTHYESVFSNSSSLGEVYEQNKGYFSSDFVNCILHSYLTSVILPTDDEVKNLFGVYYNDMSYKFKIMDEVLFNGRHQLDNYDIIKPLKGEYIKTLQFKEGFDNSKLNVNLNLYTNGLHCFDIIREEGKPEKIIIL